MKLERSFDDPNFTLTPVSARWTIKVAAMGTNCGTEMVFGSLEGGGSILKCPTCDNGGEFPGISVDSIGDAVLERMMRLSKEASLPQAVAAGAEGAHTDQGR